jgi:hypothetical protein
MNAMQEATDLVEMLQTGQGRSPLLCALVFFFLRCDLPYDFRVLVWSSLAGSWKLFTVDETTEFGRHLQPLETNKRVLALMEAALRSGTLTLQSNGVMYWLAIHHLSGWWADPSVPQWTRDQLLSRLAERGPAIVEDMQWYRSSARPSNSGFPPAHGK